MATTSGLPESFYKEALEHCHTFNCRLMAERQVRLPYLDSQTGVAQSNCSLWFEKRHRGPGLRPNQVYTYPSKRWKKKPRSTPLSDLQFGIYPAIEKRPTVASTPAVEQHIINENSNDSSNQAVDFDAVSETLDAGAEDFADDDEDYYDEDSRSRKRTRKVKGKGGKLATRNEHVDERDKPHACIYCRKRYKNKPGLNYHLQHYHQDELEADDEYTPVGSGRQTPSIMEHESATAVPKTVLAQSSSSRANSTAGSNIAEDLEEEEKSSRGKRKRQTVSAYCDFCLGDSDENKKTGESEELISCSDCGRSGHPTCLQFTDIMTMNVKKYRWQCIECKSCHLCGTSDNDDQLLFCDDCDRGYHMYCLNPPMVVPPEGSWICNLCESDRKVRESQRNQGKTSTNL